MSFSWKASYEKIAETILEYRDKQNELIDILRNLKNNGIDVIKLDDKPSKDSQSELKEIDPFTFFANFNRGIKDVQRKKIVEYILQKFNLNSIDTPVDFDGIPIANNRKSWFFGFKYERGADDIGKLWDLFESLVLNTSKIEENFDAALKINGVGMTYITMGCFWINPDVYLSLDNKNIAYAKEVFSFDIEVTNKTDFNFKKYEHILTMAKNKFGNKKFYEISSEAENFSKKESKNISRQYWSGGCSWDGESKVRAFVDGNYWQIGWERDADNKGAKQAWRNLKKVKTGDYLAFHGYGGQNDLKIYHLAEVVGKSEDEGKLYLKSLNNISLYNGKAPKLTHGTWFGTLFPIEGTLAIQKIFGIQSEKYKEPVMNDLNTFEKAILELLKHTHQIILTGAPGTGKTYLAKQLAYALTGDTSENHPHVEFCQFHPSLDYTDFVEGLRPISSPDNKEIGFERKDGIFKSFCKKALRNYIDSQKNQQEIAVERSAEDKINAFLNESIENELRFATTNGNAFFIREFDDRRISIEIPENEKTSKIIDNVPNLVTGQVV